MSVDSSPASPPLKRKRHEAEDDLEIDLNLPEPLSKKEARRAKKRKDKPAATADGEGDEATQSSTTRASKNDEEESEQKQAAKRSEFGIWIGNLPFTISKLDVREFLCRPETGIEDKDITRVHMPAATTGSSRGTNGPPAAREAQKAKNKGFAYVDFTTAEVLAKALELSEQLVLGRRVLIKNAKSFEGRPAVDKAAAGAALEQAGKPASKRVFVGNLPFNVDAEQLKQHFSQCGEVADVHMATFEDSGKCKGYAWVTFEELEAATAAVRGFVLVHDHAEDDEDEEDDSKPPKRPRRKQVDRIEGRVIRREFAEDKTVRYNKRFGKGAKRDEQQQSDSIPSGVDDGITEVTNGRADSERNATTAHARRRDRRLADKQGSREKAKQRYIPHDTAPRAAKATGSIPVGQAGGTKVSFD